jgi:phenylpropionate dioxygenase-like ring-hydroxylating dioxygenase large terminal subunit
MKSETKMNSETKSADNGSAYYLSAPSSDLDLVAVGKGTPAGELLRRYWHPIAVANEVKDLPIPVRVLGEDLILFKTPRGEFGLVYPRCCHRGTTLYYGKVEDRGIRCCYHGWLFGTDGKCLDQPCEPNGGDKRENYRQPWYPVQERYGLVFAYMGPPDRMPALPRYDVLEQVPDGLKLVADGNTIPSGGPHSMPCNWFQTHENVMDPAHVLILHQGQFPDTLTNGFDELGFEPAEGRVYGWSITRLPDRSELRFSAEVVLPTVRIIPDPLLGTFGKSNSVAWALPIDDTNTRIFTAYKIPLNKPPIDSVNFRAYGNGRNWFELDAEGHQRFPGDYEAQCGQGDISFHSEEHLAWSDRGVAMFRRIFRQAIRTVQEGGDPPNTQREDFVIKVRAAAEFIPAPANQTAR